VNVFKKGNPMEMDNYRGISLMPMELKIMTIMMTERIMRVLERERLLAMEQAGFRWREECPAQAVALVEAIERRREQKLLSFLMFVDLSKAYDVVPHEAMFAKLYQIGVRGRMLAYIRALYELSEVRVRGSSNAFRLNRGLRQGCPLSPILFDIFINDLYGRPDVVRKKVGVRVPGVPEKEGLLPGLLFADDLVAIAKSRQDMQTQADRVSLWCARWEMKVGISKCAVMCMGDKKDEDVARGQELLKLAPIRISRQDVPVEEEYTYLGILLTRDINMKVMAEGRLEKAKKALAVIRPMLRDDSIPLAVRVMVFKTRVMSSVLYGSEVWGMKEELCTEAQKLVNTGLRLIMKTRGSDTSIPMNAVWREVGVAPVYAVAAGRRARAFKKFGSLKTWCRILFQYPVSGRDVWRGYTSWWLNKYYEGLIKRAPRQFADCIRSDDDRKKLTYGKKVERVTWARKELTASSEGFKQYVECRYGSTAWSSLKAIPMSAVAEQVRLGRGMRMISMCRMNALRTASRMAKPWEGSKKPPPLSEEYQKKCPCCGEVVEKGETVEHIIVECSRWAEQRERYVKPLMDKIVQQHLARTGKGICILLLGGEYAGNRLSGWLPSGKKRSTTQAGPYGLEEVSCGAFQMARFLQALERPRYRILRQTRRRVAENRIHSNSHLCRSEAQNLRFTRVGKSPVLDKAGSKAS
jgi:hypothetical protein